MRYYIIPLNSNRRFNMPILLHRCMYVLFNSISHYLWTIQISSYFIPFCYVFHSENPPSFIRLFIMNTSRGMNYDFKLLPSVVYKGCRNSRRQSVNVWRNPGTYYKILLNNDFILSDIVWYATAFCCAYLISCRFYFYILLRKNR